MTKRSNTENEAASARALGGFNRVAGLVRASVEIAWVTNRLAKIAQQQIPIEPRTLLSRTGHGLGRKGSVPGDRGGSQSSPEEHLHAHHSGSADAIHAIDGFATKFKAIDAMTRVSASVLAVKATDRVGLASGATTSMPSGAKSSRETSDRESPEDVTRSSRSRFARMIQRSSSGMEALTRIGNSERRFDSNDSIFRKARIESGGARFERGSAPSWSGLSRRAKRMLEGVVGFSIGSDAGSERSVGKYVAASRVPSGSMIAPASFSKPEFAEPTRGVYGQESRNAPGSITINSTPTVVINGSEGSTDVEGQVIGALRAHRDELFDQFKRESVRRERAEF